MARVVKPGTVFGSVYKPLETGEWKTRVLDSNRKLSEQWRDPEVVEKAVDSIGGVIANWNEKRKGRKAAQERLKADDKGQAALKPTDPREMAALARDRANKQAVVGARRMLKRRGLEDDSKIQAAEGLLARAKAQDWEGRAAVTRDKGLKRQQEYVDRRMKQGYGSLAEARSLAARASDADDPNEALKLRKQAALARSLAYDRTRGNLLSDVIGGEIESQETRKDLKELFPPIMRKPEDNKGRGSGGGPKGAMNQDPAKKARQRFNDSPVRQAVVAATELQNAGFQDRNTPLRGRPAGFDVIPLGDIESIGIEVSSIPGALMAPGGRVIVRQATPREIEALAKENLSSEVLNARLINDAINAVNRASDPNSLASDAARLARHGRVLSAFESRYASAFRGGEGINLYDMSPNAEADDAWLMGASTVARPFQAAGGGSSGGGGETEEALMTMPQSPEQVQQARTDELSRTKQIVRRVRLRYKGDPDGGNARVEQAREIIRMAADAGQPVNLEQVVAQIEQR